MPKARATTELHPKNIKSDCLFSASLESARQAVRDGDTAKVKANLQRSGILTASGKLKDLSIA